MYRRVVSLFLLPCVLLTQSAALGHSHGGNQPAGHDLRAHIHTDLAFFSQAHDHGHHHGPDCPGHHHHDGDDAPEPGKQPPSPPEPLSDHDSDAVYISSVDVVVSKRSSVENALTVSALWAAVVWDSSADLLANPPHQVANWTDDLPPSGCACPLYIRQLALLI